MATASSQNRAPETLSVFRLGEHHPVLSFWKVFASLAI
jgi:hypothetical protein